MPWGKRTEGNKVCVYKKSTGKIMHCYSGTGADAKANRYLAALHMHADKELEDISNGMYLRKEDDGRYLITTVSTAAVKDHEGETFDVAAIDWDIKEAERTGNYPEYRLFHKKALPIGRVEKMQRVGIFAVDQGHSYTDPFSIEVCEKMLSNNNGKWRCSRGFYVHEASGICPNCTTPMIITKEHMMVGFKCPHCKTVHMGYKGVLKEVHFRKARTFDVTITDIPCVPYTGVSARKEDFAEVKEMLKSQLKQRLLDAGVKEDIVDAQLAKYTDAQLKEISDIPEAVLKELDLEIIDDGEIVAEEDVPEAKEDVVAEEEQTFTLDPSVLTAFAKIVTKEVDRIITQRLDGLEIDVDGGEEKEYSDIEVLKDQVASLTAAVEKLTGVITSTDKERLKEVLEDTPRNGKLRIVRFKAKADPDEEDDDEEPDEDEDDMMMEGRMKKKAANVVIKDAEGKSFSSMTQFVTKSN